MMRALSILLTVFAVSASDEGTDVAIRSPGGPGCQLETAGYASGFHSVEISVDGLARHFLLFVPTSYQPHEKSVLWLLGPGAFETAARFLHVSDIRTFAEEKGFAFAVLQSTMIEGLNVGLHGLAIPGQADDVAYVRAILRDVSGKLCLNMNRIRCTGYSRGARFCSRLASELSNYVASIAPVAGLRFPVPNNATRKLPIIALHGTDDRINPYWGNGDPSYWNASIPDAVQSWADFNGCKYQKWVKASDHIIFSKHFDCTDDASVVLVMIQGDGHTWAGSDAFVDPLFGHTTKDKYANDVIFEFFSAHPMRPVCHNAAPGELCFDAVMKAMLEGPDMHPEWGGSISSSSTFEEYQSVLHFGIFADCAQPCQVEIFPQVFSALPAIGSSMLWSNSTRGLQHIAQIGYRFNISMSAVVVFSSAAAFLLLVVSLAHIRARCVHKMPQHGAATIFLNSQAEYIVASGEADTLYAEESSQFWSHHVTPLAPEGCSGEV